MAGQSVDDVSWPMDLARDGTRLFVVDNGTGLVTEHTSDWLPILASYDPSQSFNVGSDGPWLCFYFPQRRDVDGWLAYAGDTSYPLSVATSPDTTNGLDGTWTVRLSGAQWDVNNNLRTQVKTRQHGATWLAVRAVRFLAGRNLFNSATVNQVHLFGEPTAGGAGEWLDFWHSVQDRRMDVNTLDWGTCPRSSSADASFRVRNASSTRSIGSTVVKTDALVTGATPAPDTTVVMSLDQVHWTATVALGTLAPQEVSFPVYARRIVPSNQTLGFWPFRFRADGVWQP